MPPVHLDSSRYRALPAGLVFLLRHQLVLNSLLRSRFRQFSRARRSEGSIDRPGFGDEQLFEEADGVTVGHTRNEVASGHVDALPIDSTRIEKFLGLLANLFPKSSQDG